MLLVALALVSPARGDTVYGPDEHPLVERSWCIHLTAAGFIGTNSLGDRRITPSLGVGFSPLRLGALRLPVVQVIMIQEADQTVEGLANKTGWGASVGFSLRLSDLDNGKFETQFHVAGSRDFTSKSNGVLVGFALGF